MLVANRTIAAAVAAILIALATLFVGGSAVASVVAAGPAPQSGRTPGGQGDAPTILSCSTVSFGTPTNYYSVGPKPEAMAVGDFNRDGSPDLATANRDSNAVSVLLADGSGGFGATTNFPVGSQPLGVAEGDFNRDGN